MKKDPPEEAKKADGQVSPAQESREPDGKGSALPAPSAHGVERDAAMLDWLSAPGRWVEIWEEDFSKSWHEDRKAVHHYINGRYTITKGNTLRAAIDAAMRCTVGDSEEKQR